MKQVFFITPYKAGDIGGGINENIAHLPDDAWVCIRDSDTLFLTPYQQKQIVAIANSEPPFDAIGCLTNRLRLDDQVLDRERLFNCGDISTHVEVAKQRESEHWGEITEAPGYLAGLMILTRVKFAKENPFPTKSITFDMFWSGLARINGFKLGIAQGIYLFHLYRWGSENPFEEIQHLMQ